MKAGHVEFGGGVGAGVRTDDGSFGGGEMQVWVRGGANDRIELGGRAFTHMFSSFGGAFDLRVAAIKGPVDLSFDLSLLGGACCLSRFEENRVLGAAVGIDGGLSFGKRFGGPQAVAIYIAPHVQLSRTFPLEKDWPVQLFLPLGVDIPLGKTPLRLRPEVMGIGLFHQEGRTEWRIAGGVGIAVQGPGAKLRRKQRREKEEERDEKEEERDEKEEERDANRALSGLPAD